MKTEDLQETIMKKTVVDWLNEISYKDDAKYIPNLFAIKFVNFIKLVNGEDGEENETPILHYRMLDAIDSPHQYLANLLFRGAAKTTVFAEYLFLYIATYGELPHLGSVNLAIYVSDSIENGVKNLRKNLEFRWEESAFLQKYVPKAKFTDTRYEFENAAGHKLIVKGYGAKALSLDTRLYTANGYTTIGQCEVGQRIYGPDGKLATITAKSEVFHKKMYKLVLEDGRSLKVSEDHINSVMVNTNPNNTAKWVDKDLTTKELLELGWEHTKKGNLKHKGTSTKCVMKVRNTAPLEYPTADVEIDPYTLGLILGDGSIKKNASGIVITGDRKDTNFYRKNIPYALGEDYADKRRENVITFAVKGINEKIRNLGLAVHGNNKFIPESYFLASINQRTELLKGLLDTDGSIFGSGRITFVSASETLTMDVARLVRSLGGKAKLCNTKNSAYHLEIWINENPFKLPRKADKFVKNRRHWDNCNVVDIQEIPLEASQCIAIDNADHQFLAGEYFRTHNTGVRGAKELGVRPQLAVLDDLVSDEDARSATVIASIEDTVSKAVDYALHPQRRKVIWNGTPFNQNDPLYKAIESGGWNVNVFPVCEKFPCTREEFVGAWADRFNYDFVRNQYNKKLLEGKLADFNQELMLRIISDEEKLIKDHDIGWYSRDKLLRNRHSFNWYITTDFAVSEQQRADDTGQSVWAVNHNRDIFWVDGVLEKLTMDKNFDKLFELVQKYAPISTGIEVDGQQKGFISLLQRAMMDRQIFFNLASDKKSGEPGIRSKSRGHKFVRFNTYAVPLFKAHKIWLPVELRDTPIVQEIVNQISLVTAGGFKSKKDDWLDTCSQLQELDIYAPSAESVNPNIEENIWGHGEANEHDNLDSYIY